MEEAEYTCCFTGHRPEKLTRSELDICHDLEAEIRKAITEGYTTFISGMAQGVDIWAAEIVLRLRQEGQALQLICAIPYEGFEAGWTADWQRRYRSVLQSADAVNYICARRCRGCYHIRNRWMVDRSSRIIAVYAGQSGGTKATIDYASRNSISIFQISG